MIHTENDNLMAEKSAMRRVPQRKRGQERVKKILDATARLIAEHGYESVTTNQIATEAQTSIGSLYQFFPNKDVILMALSERYLSELRAIMGEQFRADEQMTPFEQCDRLIDTFHDFYMNNPGFKPMFYGSYGLDSLTSAGEEFYQDIVEQFDALFARRFHLPEDGRIIAVLVLVSIVKTQVTMIDEADENLRPALLNELKAVSRAYIKSLLERHGLG